MNKTGIALGLILIAAVSISANADQLGYDDCQWASSVVSWNGNIKNFGGTLMSDATTWWVTGEPDCDVDGNGYAWDSVDNDYVAGWKMPFLNDSITVTFDTAIDDGPGDDVLVVGYRGPGCLASIQASSDGVNFTELGTIGSGTPGYLSDFWFDLGGLDDVQYIRVERATGAAYSAAFIDTIGVVPEPASGLLLAFAGLVALTRRR